MDSLHFPSAAERDRHAPAEKTNSFTLFVNSTPSSQISQNAPSQEILASHSFAALAQTCEMRKNDATRCFRESC
jgi:hypothetical protein